MCTPFAFSIQCNFSSLPSISNLIFSVSTLSFVFVRFNGIFIVNFTESRLNYLSLALKAVYCTFETMAYNTVLAKQLFSRMKRIILKHRDSSLRRYAIHCHFALLIPGKLTTGKSKSQYYKKHEEYCSRKKFEPCVRQRISDCYFLGRPLTWYSLPISTSSDEPVTVSCRANKGAYQGDGVCNAYKRSQNNGTYLYKVAPSVFTRVHAFLYASLFLHIHTPNLSN